MDEITRQSFIKDKYDFEDLKRIVWQLRAPDGCPWDREQTHESMHDCLIEETFEVIEAINNKDVENLREELGDVMLQVLMHSVIAEENKEFTFNDIVDELAHKLVRRHPHVFGEEKADTGEEGLMRWESIKKQEKKDAKSEKNELSRIPKELPPVMRAHKLIRKSNKLYGKAVGSEELLIQVKKFEEASETLTKAMETFIKDNEG